MGFIGFIFIRQPFHKFGLNVSRFEHENQLINREIKIL
jgi:hypothetical protein